MTPRFYACNEILQICRQCCDRMKNNCKMSDAVLATNALYLGKVHLSSYWTKYLIVIFNLKFMKVLHNYSMELFYEYTVTQKNDYSDFKVLV